MKPVHWKTVVILYYKTYWICLCKRQIYVTNIKKALDKFESLNITWGSQIVKFFFLNMQSVSMLCQKFVNIRYNSTKYNEFGHTLQWEPLLYSLYECFGPSPDSKPLLWGAMKFTILVGPALFRLFICSNFLFIISRSAEEDF